MPIKKRAKPASRSAFVQLRLSAQEKARFAAAAARDRRTLSDFARLAMEDRATKMEGEKAGK